MGERNRERDWKVLFVFSGSGWRQHWLGRFLAFVLYGSIPLFLCFGGQCSWTSGCGMACCGTRREFGSQAARRFLHREGWTLALLRLYYRYARRKSRDIHPHAVRKKMPLDRRAMAAPCNAGCTTETSQAKPRGTARLWTLDSFAESGLGGRSSVESLTCRSDRLSREPNQGLGCWGSASSQSSCHLEICGGSGGCQI